MKSTSRRLALLILVAAQTLVGNSATAATGNKGRLFIIGGGHQPTEMIRRFIELAGGTNHAKIIVVPLASEDAEESGKHQVSEFQKHGVAHVESIVFTREEAGNPATVARFADATGVFFTGGDQTRLAAIITNSPVHQKLKELYARGAVMGGTSAGAAVMSQVMITGEELRNDDKTNAFTFIRRNNIETTVGFGFITNAIIDQHFIRRKRLNRLFSTVLEHPHLVGIGIDESTAIIVDPDDTFEVIGESAVMVMDPRAATHLHTDQKGNLSASNIRTHILLAGDRFDLNSGKIIGRAGK